MMLSTFVPSAMTQIDGTTPQHFRVVRSSTTLETFVGTKTSHFLLNEPWLSLIVSTLLLLITTAFALVLVGFSPYNMYSKALLASAATSALRLHQRLPRVQLSREFLALLFVEDSAHYLMYSLIFFYSPPLTWVLLPVFLFALLHISSYTLELLDLFGPNSMSLIRMGIGIVEVQSANLLWTIAFAEIFLFPLVVLSLFSGRATLMTVFIYYRFLTLRYASRRNAYTRDAFSRLRFLTENYTQKPNCPQVVRNIATKTIDFITRLTPAVVQQQSGQ
uniref:EOG090X0CJA n=1 Tax=Moina brachiata TaxID=675436 RepID=A0A4Y7NKU8_9CRUS|nr:EOG090X0CJA [Moina brachiata]SVE93236.1 EOG090X0CJA [Moina brachiata]